MKRLGNFANFSWRNFTVFTVTLAATFNPTELLYSRNEKSQTINSTNNLFFAEISFNFGTTFPGLLHFRKRQLYRETYSETKRQRDRETARQRDRKNRETVRQRDSKTERH